MTIRIIQDYMLLYQTITGYKGLYSILCRIIQDYNGLYGTVDHNTELFLTILNSMDVYRTILDFIYDYT